MRRERVGLFLKNVNGPFWRRFSRCRISVKQLCLNDNPLGDVEGFWAALRAGSMPCLVQLYWYSAGLGDAGLAALAQALGAGALPALKDLFLQENAFGDVGLEVRPLPAYCLHPLPEPHPAHRPQRA